MELTPCSALYQQHALFEPPCFTNNNVAQLTAFTPPQCFRQRSRHHLPSSPVVSPSSTRSLDDSAIRTRMTKCPGSHSKNKLHHSTRFVTTSTLQHRRGLWQPLHVKYWDPYDEQQYNDDDEHDIDFVAEHNRRHSSIDVFDNADDEPFLISLVDRISSILSIPTPGIKNNNNPPLALGYPLFLALTFLLLPFTTSVLLTVFFVGFCSLGRWLVPREEEDYDDSYYEEEVDDYFFNQGATTNSLFSTDLVALGGAVVSSALLAPSSSAEVTLTTSGLFMSNSYFSLIMLVPLTTILAVVLVTKGFDDVDKLFALVVVLASKSLDDVGQGSKSNNKASPDHKLLEMWDDEFELKQKSDRRD